MLDASLVVAYLALRQGDAVGLLASGGDSRWLAPQRGLGAIDTLLQRHLRPARPKPVATDFLEAATQLALRQRRRALVMLVTNVRDEDFDDLLAGGAPAAGQAPGVRRPLREKVLDAALDAAGRQPAPTPSAPARSRATWKSASARTARCAARA